LKEARASDVVRLLSHHNITERPMADPQSIDVRRRLASLVPDHRLRDLARESGFVVRQKKIDPVAFFWTLVFGFACSKERTISALRRAFEATTGKCLAPSSFYDRFTPTLVAFMKAVFLGLAAKLAEPSRALAGTLADFKDLVVTDSTVVRLHDLLAKAFPACRTNHTRAALKIHLVMSVCGTGPRSVKVTSERVHDSTAFRVGKWVKDRLLLFDMGYFRYQLFDCIRRNGGYFLTRLKSHANPVIVAVHRQWRGASIQLVGQRLQDVLERLQREVLDVEIEVRFPRRTYGGKRSRDTARFRLVGLRNDETGEYHLYVTNLPADRIPAASVGVIYRARWTIEMLFKQLKSSFALEDMPSSKPCVVEALLYATLVTLVSSNTLLAAVRERLGVDAPRATELRWAVVLRSYASLILLAVVARGALRRPLGLRVGRGLLHEALDPHLGRPALVEQVERGLVRRRRARAS
jgi:putative transposase